MSECTCYRILPLLLLLLLNFHRTLLVSQNTGEEPKINKLIFIKEYAICGGLLLQS